MKQIRRDRKEEKQEINCKKITISAFISKQH